MFMIPAMLKSHIIWNSKGSLMMYPGLVSIIYYKADEVASKGLQLVEPNNTNRYHWVAAEVVGTLSILNNVEVITNVVITVDNPSDWSVLPVGLKERIYISFKGCLVPLYE